MYPLPEKVSWYKNTLLEGKQRSATLKRKENSLAFEWCNLFVFLAPLRRVPSSKKSASKLSGGFWLRGGKRKESLQLHVKNTWKQVRAKGNDVITNVISHRLFRCKYSNSRNVVARSPSFSRPTARASPRVCSQAIQQRVFVSCKGPISAVYARKKRQEN